jgi:spermidine synthase
LLLVDGTPQSHVDLAEARYLEFEYVRRLGHVVDLMAEPGEPLAVVHLGAGGLTLARYVAATRPGSRQRAVESSAEVAELVRELLPLPRGVRVPVQVADARDALGRLGDDSADLVVVDVFAGAQTPAHLTSVELVRDVSRVLRPGGVHAMNVADGPPLDFARGQVATAQAVFGHVAVLAEPAVWRRRRFGNLVLLGSDAPLPVEGLTRRCASDPVAARVEAGRALQRFVAGAQPVTDADAQPSPAAPPGLFGRR